MAASLKIAVLPLAESTIQVVVNTVQGVGWVGDHE